MVGLITAGFQKPVIPFVEVFGNIGIGPTPQMVMLFPNENWASVLGITVTLITTVVPQVPAAGLNVYVPEFWLSITPGLQLPAMPLLDAGSAGAGLPWQSVDGGREVNFVGMIGFCNGTEINSCLMVPFRLKVKSPYEPAFRLEMVTCPAASVTRVIGPIVTPLSV